MTKCKFCGARLPDGTAVCPSCGKSKMPPIVIPFIPGSKKKTVVGILLATAIVSVGMGKTAGKTQKAGSGYNETSSVSEGTDAYNEGFAAYDRNDYSNALKYFLIASKQGNSDAQFFLGKMYTFGFGVEQDFHKAIQYHQLAADQGHVLSQNILGIMYENGIGAMTDYHRVGR